MLIQEPAAPLWKKQRENIRSRFSPEGSYIYIFIHQNMIERTGQKVQQKSTHKKRKKTTIEQVTQIYI